MKTRLLLLTFVLHLSSNTFAQTYTEIFEGGWGKGMTFSKPTSTDFDSDGLLDLIIGNQEGKMKHYEQGAIGRLPLHLFPTVLTELMRENLLRQVSLILITTVY